MGDQAKDYDVEEVLLAGVERELEGPPAIEGGGKDVTDKEDTRRGEDSSESEEHPANPPS
jgi:hypothetical protein